MRYLLTTMHRYPKFYKLDGSIVEIKLNYVESKTVSSIDEQGQLSHVQISGSPPCIGDLWMVDSIEESLHRLEVYGVYPYISKAAARDNAQRLGLQSFKYIAVP